MATVPDVRLPYGIAFVIKRDDDFVEFRKRLIGQMGRMRRHFYDFRVNEVNKSLYGRSERSSDKGTI